MNSLLETAITMGAQRREKHETSSTCQVTSIGPQEGVLVHAGLTDHLQELHAVWNHAAQVLQVQVRSGTKQRAPLHQPPSHSQSTLTNRPTNHQDRTGASRTTILVP